MANVTSQGGSEKIIENKKFTMDNMGTMMDGVLFPKTGTMVEPYSGNKTEVSQGTTTFPSQ